MSSSTVSAAVNARTRRTGVSPRPPIEQAIVRTVAYADVFDYPLTADELQRYLIGAPATRAAVRDALGSRGLIGVLVRSGRYVTLADREATIAQRRARAVVSASLWPPALRYGRLIGSLPLVRMVAVTGALAMDNVADGDVDFLIVTAPERLWVCRAMVISVVRMARVRGVTLCPNYFLSERALELADHNLFTAHEMTQMVPLTGHAVYDRLRHLNRWTTTFLPNAGGPPHRFAVVEPRARRRRALAEAALRTRLGHTVERWEMRRKVRKLGSQSHGHTEAAFSSDWCKGHFDDHGQLTLSRYAERLRVLEPHLAGGVP